MVGDGMSKPNLISFQRIGVGFKIRDLIRIRVGVRNRIKGRIGVGVGITIRI